MARDLSMKQYYDALKRHGFEPEMLGYVRHKDVPGRAFPPILDARTFKIRRRDSLANFIQRKNRILREAQNG